MGDGYGGGEGHGIGHHPVDRSIQFGVVEVAVLFAHRIVFYIIAYQCPEIQGQAVLQFSTVADTGCEVDTGFGGLIPVVIDGETGGEQSVDRAGQIQFVGVFGFVQIEIGVANGQ